MFTAQLICQGACRQVDIVRAFGVAKNGVIRSVARYQAGGVQAFYAPRATRGASVMTPEVTARAQQLLGAGRSRNEVAERLGLKRDTLRKAIQQRRLIEPCPRQPEESAAETAPAQPTPRANDPSARDVPPGGVGPGNPQPTPGATDRSTRAVLDAAAEMGTACTRPDERALASFGLLDAAPTRFETCRDVACGGVLCPCRPWRPMACSGTSRRAWHGCAATTARCT